MLSPSNTPPEKKTFTVDEKETILIEAQKIGVKQAAKLHDASAVSIYKWRKQYEKEGRVGLEDKRQDNPGAKPIADWKRTKVLAIKETDPGFGPSQIRNQLRGGVFRVGLSCPIDYYKLKSHKYVFLPLEAVR